MKDNDKLELLLERFFNRYNKYNTKVLKVLGETIKQFEGLTPTQAHQLAQELKYSRTIDDLVKELARLSGVSTNDVFEAFDLIAKENTEFARAYAEAKGIPFTPYSQDSELIQLTKAIAGQTSATFVNLANTQAIGFTFKGKDGHVIFKNLRQTFNDLIDEALFNTTTGVTDYQSAMRSTIRQLADSGVKIHEYSVGYASGYNRRIDSTVRQNVLTGIRQVNLDIQKQVGRAYGADGVEVSAHEPCAVDHLPINGRQYSNAEFRQVNNALERPVGTLNCRHFVFSIVLGVNEPEYTDEQLEEMEKESQKIIEYDGKQYTKYEATQEQRRLETAIRKQKDRQIIARYSGDLEEVGKAQENITKLSQKYVDFSQKAGLKTYKNKLVVSDYRKVKVK